MAGFFYRFPRTLVQCLHWRFLVWHVIAIASTIVLVGSGFDWWWYSLFRGTAMYRAMFPAAPIGGLLPILLPLALLIAGKVNGNARITNAAFAIGQAAILGSLISSFYKAFTGRAHPMMRLTTALVDNSRQFRFGLLKGGIFWGWPSSHTTIAFACAVAVLVLFPEEKLVRFCAVALAVYIGLGVSMTIHWFSDFVAGAMIGATIGIATGRSFRERLRDVSS